ncbi:OmpA family protein [Ruegeria aquimaris]|uniref:OmpA family protein n=1 Tax=Ruegeria aquimaris TaxID=2984333 RepID=A0ABT3APP9_9RHOB|nr:OmpA family protein [Ruegeria sp. XHP0148]MCV2890667.1 OmpA family protein [Ruegeria sp. XHP0148]
MRAQAKQIRHEEEEESAFVSMTDMTVGFLFIMMILLAFFASQARETETVPLSRFDEMVEQRDEWRALAETRAETIARLEKELEALRLRVTELNAQVKALTEERDALQAEIASLKADNEALKQRVRELEELVLNLQERIRNLEKQIKEKDEEIEKLQAQLAELKKVDPLEAYLARVSIARREVLTRLRDAILADFPDLKVELSEESDALRFQGEGLFASGRSNLARDKAAIVSKLAERLDEILPCFTLGDASRFDEACNPAFALVEAVQIEGHTDNRGTDQVNRSLSAARANSTFFAMTGAAKGVMQHLNLKRQPVLSVAAYGPDRPVTTNDTAEGRATNRRIDLRFIMVTPQDTGGIQVIREALQAVGERQ